MDIILAYGDKEKILVKAYKEKDVLVVPRNLLPKGVFPNGKIYYHIDNMILRTEYIRKKDIGYIIIGIVAIIAGLIGCWWLGKNKEGIYEENYTEFPNPYINL